MQRTDQIFSQQNLKELFDYKDGNLYWKKSKGRRIAGTLAGTKSHTYCQVCINYVLYRNHRLIWIYHNNECPKEIDHINGNTFDNRIENLRNCSKSQNQFNKKISKNNTSSIKGISWSKQKKKWRARISVDGQEKHIGFFDCLKKAEKAISQKRILLHGVFSKNA